MHVVFEASRETQKGLAGLSVRRGQEDLGSLHVQRRRLQCRLSDGQSREALGVDETDLVRDRRTVDGNQADAALSRELPRRRPVIGAGRPVHDEDAARSRLSHGLTVRPADAAHIGVSLCGADGLHCADH